MNIIEHYSDKINGALSSFDRIIINGYILSLQNPRQFLFYLISNSVKLLDFHSFAKSQTDSLCLHIDSYANDCGVDITYLSSPKTNKDELARAAFDKDPSRTGLIAAFSSVELCRTMTVVSNHQTLKLETASRQTKCKHYYLYYNDVEFGWMFIKIQTWFPYNVQIYINGREYLSKLFDKNNINYEMYHNSFSFIDDFDKAQKIANDILNKKISSSFDGMIKKINVHLPVIEQTMGHSYYWCLDQCEFATDINFKKREDLSIIYKKLVETSYFAFNCHDIYSFFGRKVEYIGRFKGEIISDLRNRKQGFRIKFKMNKNQIKMYDKGNNLRIEITINNPAEFKVLKNDDETGSRRWKPMGKSIANLYRYSEVSESITKRFIEALPTVDSDIVTLKEIKEISKAKEVNGRRYSGFNLLNESDLKLFKEISDGSYLISGFNNKLLRKKLYEDSGNQKNINRMTRTLAKLRKHGIIKKAARKNNYYLTAKGRRITTSLQLYTGKEVLA